MKKFTMWARTADEGLEGVDEIYAYEIENDAGMTARIMDFGATLLSLEVPVGKEDRRDVVLGFEEIEDYFVNDPYFGVVVGPCANRIGGANFSLNGKSYHLIANDGINTNHSGGAGFQKRKWRLLEHTENKVSFKIRHPLGELGFPGGLVLKVTYCLGEQGLIIDYDAMAENDTLLNPTNHSYFNLDGQGKGDILKHSLKIYADAFTPGGKTSVPDGEVRSVEGTPLDFRKSTEIGERINSNYDEIVYAKGYDHNYILDKSQHSERYSSTATKVFRAATITDSKGDLKMKVYTSMPGLQIYTGNYLSGEEIGKGKCRYTPRSGIALETQFFPNAVNVEAFETPLIRAKEERHFRTVYEFVCE